MPRLVKAYGCEFKCGEKVQTHKDRIIAHEVNCFLNPAVRACKSCVHNMSDYEEVPIGGDQYTVIKWFYCDVEKLPEDKKAVRDCAFWKAKAIKDKSPQSIQR